ncbi:hypothetical protein MCHK_3009 [Mesorhizobium huakuii 7653R]|nr:hypothetical protein MCHK_3009 [Mesorhizobium huakuii 7653R]
MTDNNPHAVEPDDELRAIDNLEDPSSVDGLMASIEKMMAGTGPAAGGWGDINDAGKGLQKQRAEQAQMFKREANIFRDTFMTEPGRKCLEIFREMTLHAQPYPPEAMLPIDAITALVIAHNAQCNFVWSIFQAIAQADNREAKPRTGS